MHSSSWLSEGTQPGWLVGGASTGRAGDRGAVRQLHSQAGLRGHARRGHGRCASGQLLRRRLAPAAPAAPAACSLHRRHRAGPSTSFLKIRIDSPRDWAASGQLRRAEEQDQHQQDDQQVRSVEEIRHSISVLHSEHQAPALQGHPQAHGTPLGRLTHPLCRTRPGPARISGSGPHTGPAPRQPRCGPPLPARRARSPARPRRAAAPAAAPTRCPGCASTTRSRPVPQVGHRPRTGSTRPPSARPADSSSSTRTSSGDGRNRPWSTSTGSASGGTCGRHVEHVSPQHPVQPEQPHRLGPAAPALQVGPALHHAAAASGPRPARSPRPGQARSRTGAAAGAGAGRRADLGLRPSARRAAVHLHGDLGAGRGRLAGRRLQLGDRPAQRRPVLGPGSSASIRSADQQRARLVDAQPQRPVHRLGLADHDLAALVGQVDRAVRIGRRAARRTTAGSGRRRARAR